MQAVAAVASFTLGLNGGYVATVFAIHEKTKSSLILLTISFLGASIGSFGAKAFGDFLGRRNALVLSHLLIAAVTLVCLSDSIVAWILARLFIGVFLGVLNVSSWIYLIETKAPNDRKRSFFVFYGGFTFGLATSMLVGLFFAWDPRVLALAVSTVTSICGFSLGAVYDSPRWLIKRGNIMGGLEALKALFPGDEVHVANEFKYLCQKNESGSKIKRRAIISLFAFAFLQKLGGYPALIMLAPALLRSLGWSGELALAGAFLVLLPHALSAIYVSQSEKTKNGFLLSSGLLIVSSMLLGIFSLVKIGYLYAAGLCFFSISYTIAWNQYPLVLLEEMLQREQSEKMLSIFSALSFFIEWLTVWVYGILMYTMDHLLFFWMLAAFNCVSFAFVKYFYTGTKIKYTD